MRISAHLSYPLMRKSPLAALKCRHSAALQCLAWSTHQPTMYAWNRNAVPHFPPHTIHTTSTEIACSHTTPVHRRCSHNTTPQHHTCDDTTTLEQGHLQYRLCHLRFCSAHTQLHSHAHIHPASDSACNTHLLPVPTLGTSLPRKGNKLHGCCLLEGLPPYHLPCTHTCNRGHTFIVLIKYPLAVANA